MLSPLLCAALALAAPADEPRDAPPVRMFMEIFPRSPMLGDVLIVKITAFNGGKEVVPLSEEYEPAFGEILIQIGYARPYRYFWRGPGGFLIGPEGVSAPPVPLPPREKRVVFFGAMELPPIRDIRRDFWTELVKERGSVSIVARLGCRGCETFWSHESFRLHPRPKEEVEALLDAYAQKMPKGFDDWGKLTPNNLGLASFPPYSSTPEELAELEAKLSDGTLRDILRATRLLQIVADKDGARDAAQRRVAAKELIALLGASAELERQWLAYNIFKRYYRRIAELDEIEWELMKAAAEDIPDLLMDKSDGNGATYAERWPLIKRRREEK
jgi:hypothetical protein